METYFFDSSFSPRDFGDIIGTLLEAEQLDFEQWVQVMHKGLELAFDQTIYELKRIETIPFDQNKQEKATSILQEIGESSILSLEEVQDLDLI